MWMNAFQVISKYFWLICIVITGVNYLFSAYVGVPRDSKVDERARRNYLAWLWGLSAIPWLVAGIGQVSGGLPDVWHLFRPQDGNPHAWAFYLSILAVYAVIVYWVLFRDGARIAEELQLLRYQTPGGGGAIKAAWIKALVVGLLPFFAFWLWMVSAMDVPLP
jgi:hypothetical protein